MAEFEIGDKLLYAGSHKLNTGIWVITELTAKVLWVTRIGDGAEDVFDRLDEYLPNYLIPLPKNLSDKQLKALTSLLGPSSV